jgi:ATP-dependent HslUV protease ATP-binding subunit HslU
VSEPQQPANGGRRRKRIDAMTPAEIVGELDNFIVGQKAGKRALAIAIRNRYRRRQLPFQERREIGPKNIMMIGPTGVGKTEMVRRVASMLEAPFLKVEATKYTEVGYVGRDVESIIQDLVEDAVVRLHDRRLRDVQTKAERRATERLVEYIVAQSAGGSLKSSTGRTPVRIPGGTGAAVATAPAPTNEEPKAETEVDELRRRRIGRMLRSEKLDDAMVEIEVTPEIDPYDGYWEFPSTETDPLREVPPPAPRGRPRSRVVCIKDAKRILAREEANKLVDFDAVVDEALERVEENGIVFIDELDKVAGRGHDMGADVSGEGVQRDLLPIVEGSVVMTRYGPVNTGHLLFIAAGSFSKVKPADLIPELQGRFPLRVELSALTQADMEAILSATQASLCGQYHSLLATEGVDLQFTADGISEVARIACAVNERVENIGARRLQTVLEQTLEEISFQAPELSGTQITVDGAYVRARTASLAGDEDLNRFIL